MCGITGLWSSSPSSYKPEHIIQDMTASLHHRGPNKQAVWISEENALALGHRRLSIIDLSDDGTQPMHSASGRYTIVYNGEIYNYRDLRAELEKGGTVFKSHSDTEVFLAGIETWGIIPTLSRITGMFAIALWDHKEKKLHLIRDRLGKKPLYVGWCGQDLVFASELKAFHTHPKFEKKVSGHARTSYITFGYVSAPHTIFESIWMLLPGHYLELNEQMIATPHNLTPLMQSYWSAEKNCLNARMNQTNLPEETIIHECDQLLRQCVKERMMASDVSLGAFLSGGIDSSAVVALMQAQSERPIKTYTIGFHEAGYNEAEHAKDIARHIGTDHHELYVSAQDALSIIDKLPDIYDEPFADISAIPTYLVSKFARESVTVTLSGDGGDEMLGGYNRHITAPAIWKKIRYLPLSLRRKIADIILAQPPEKLAKLRPDHPQFAHSLYKAADILKQKRQPQIYQRLLQQIDHPTDYLRETSPLDIPLYNITGTDNLDFSELMMLGDTIHYLPNDILTKVDRASMAVALEARAPLLDHRIFEYVWTLPLSFKIRDKQGKWLLQKILAQYVPEHLFKRPKHGFNLPVAYWLSHELKDWAEDLLQEDKLDHNGFDAAKVRALWHQYQQGRIDHAHFIWSICQYQAWSQKWL